MQQCMTPYDKRLVSEANEGGMGRAHGGDGRMATQWLVNGRFMWFEEE